MPTSRRPVLWPSLALLFLFLLPGMAGALGPAAPPRITYVNVTVDTAPFSYNGQPYLSAGIGVEIPGGHTPLNVQSVTVSVPTTPTPTLITVPLDRLDLVTEDSFWVNLTAAGIPAGVYPAGTYTFTVTDTAGGVSTATDNLGPVVLLAPTSSITMTGLIPTPAALGTYNLLNLAATPNPTVTWAAVAGAQNYRLRIRNGFNDQDLFRWQTGNGVTTSVTLPEGVFRPGRRYFVRVEAYDHVNGYGCTPVPPAASCNYSDMNVRARNQIEIVTPGPEIQSVNIFCGGAGCTWPVGASGPYAVPGTILGIRARIYNTALPVDVIAEGWIGVPGGGIVSFLPPTYLTIPANPNADFFNNSNGDIFTHTFTGAEPAGIYTVGLRFRDPQTGETIAVSTRPFRFN